MEFWDSKVQLDDTDIHERMSSDDDDILKHVQNLDIGDNFMDDDDDEDSYDSGPEDHSRHRENRENREPRDDGEGALNNDYPDDLSDISDLFENDAHLLNLDIGMSNNGAPKNREVQMLSLDEVPYSRDLKWINTPDDERPKPRISRTSNRFLKQVQGITSQNVGELTDLDRHYRGLDQKKRDYDLSGSGGRDRRRGRTNGGLEAKFVAPTEPLGDALAARGPGKLVVFDDDPKPSQRRKRPYRQRTPRGEGRSDGRSEGRSEGRGERRSDSQRGDRDGGRNRDGRGAGGGSKDSRDRGQYSQRDGQNGQRGDKDASQSRSNRSNSGSAQGQSPRTLYRGQPGGGGALRQEMVTIQPRSFLARPLMTPTTAPVNPGPAVTLSLRSAPFVPQPVKNQQLISETNAIKLRADAPVWTPPTAYT